MPGLLPRDPARARLDLSFAFFLLTVVLSLLRARDLPSLDVGLGATRASITPADAALAVTAVLALVVLRGRRPAATPLVACAALFAALIVVSSLPLGADAVTAAGKLAELVALTLGAVAFLDSPERLRRLLVVVVAFTAAAVVWGLVGFLASERERQASFVGEHDLAALATLVLALGLARLNARPPSGGLAIVALATGVIGVVLAASLASLIGVYLVAAVVLAIAWARDDARAPAFAVTLLVVAAATAGTLAQRQGELGFLTSWFGPPPENPAIPAASLSQRLIFAYIGGRVFLEQPVLGTGWHGELPAEEFARFLPDARSRFPDEPAHYFPPSSGTLIPQQAYDQVLYELGLVGLAVFGVLGGLAVRRALRARRRSDPDAAYVPAAWLFGIGAALLGSALFGGSPLTALFWLTLGVVAAEPEPA